MLFDLKKKICVLFVIVLSILFSPVLFYRSPNSSNFFFYLFIFFLYKGRRHFRRLVFGIWHCVVIGYHYLCIIVSAAACYRRGCCDDLKLDFV